MIEEEVLGLRSDEPERRRRDADADAQVFLTQPLQYAPTYPYYPYNTALYVPTIKKVDEVNMEKMVEAETMKDEEEMMKDEEMMETRKMAYYLPQYAPSYYYPSVIPQLVQYPTGVKTTVSQRVSPWYPVSNVQYPFAYPGLVSQVGVQQFLPPLSPAEVPAERILPNEPQAGEEESAALLL